MDNAQIERLVVLANETAKVLTAITNALNNGLDEIHEETGMTAAEELESVLGDFHYVANWMFAEGDILTDGVGRAMSTKAERLSPILKHQGGEDDGSEE